MLRMNTVMFCLKNRSILIIFKYLIWYIYACVQKELDKFESHIYRCTCLYGHCQNKQFLEENLEFMLNLEII